MGSVSQSQVSNQYFLICLSWSGYCVWSYINIFHSGTWCLYTILPTFLEKAMMTYSSTLAWKILWMEEPGRLQSMGSLKSQTPLSDFTFTFHFHALEKEMATHSCVLAWRIPGMGEPGGLPSMGLHRAGHDWSDLAATTHIFGTGFLDFLNVCSFLGTFCLLTLF